MIIGTSLKYVFVSVPKSGTHTMYDLLPSKFEGQHVSDLLGKKLSYHHREIPEDYADFLKFTIVRNPFERAVSIWWSNVKFGPGSDWCNRYIEIMGDDTFSSFSKLLTNWNSILGTDGLRGQVGLFPQHEWLKPVSVDKILHLDKLEEQFNALPFVKEPVSIQPVLKRDKDRPWQEYYDEQSEKNIREWAGEDFEKYGFSTKLDS